MILVTRLNGKQFYLNSELIETMEATPDTVVTLTGGNKYVVVEGATELNERIAEFRRSCHPHYVKLEERTGNEP
ncbi:MAG: flagellar FlbD family protein [Desulfitobacteriaceae bacterium]